MRNWIALSYRRPYTALVVFFVFFAYLQGKAQTVSWAAKASIPTAKVFSASFTISGIEYVGTGYTDGSDATPTTSFVKYDPSANTWTGIAAFPGAARGFAVGFSAGGFGFVGGGVNAGASSTSTYFTDWYKYNPTTNTWTAVASFPGSARAGSFAFAIGTNGYVGTGFNGSVDFQDFYQYNTLTNTWTAKANFAGGLRDDATAFTIGSLAYVGTGETFNTTPFTDFYKYDPSANTWTSIAGFPGTARAYANGFSVGTFGFVGTGLVDATAPGTDWYQYNSTTNAWTTSTSFPGAARSGTFAFVAGMNGFLGSGYDNGVLQSDMFQFTTNITPLPLTLLSFTGRPSGDGTVALSWATGQEENTASFIIERSQDGAGFINIGSVPAAGNSQTVLTYSWVDTHPSTGVGYYRLQMEDLDGKSTYSQVIAIQREAVSNSFRVYPNPATDALHIQLGPGMSSGPVRIRVTDASGNTVKTALIISPGGNVVTVDVSELGRGIYYISCNGSGSAFLKN